MGITVTLCPAAPRSSTHPAAGALPRLTHPPPARCPGRVPRRDHRAPSAPAAGPGRGYATRLRRSPLPPPPQSRLPVPPLRSHAAKYPVSILAVSCALPPAPSLRKDPVQHPFRRSKGARGELGAAPGARPPHAAGMEPGSTERSGERGGLCRIPATGAGLGAHSPSSSQLEPAEPRSGASIPAARPAPCSRALRRAPGALPARPRPAAPRTLPQHRAVFLAPPSSSSSSPHPAEPSSSGLKGAMLPAGMRVGASLTPRKGREQRRQRTGRGGGRGQTLLRGGRYFHLWPMKLLLDGEPHRSSSKTLD